MIRALLISVAAGLAFWLLGGCSSAPPAQPQELAAAARAGSPILVATLSTNACEATTAPVYTAATVAIERAARYVRSGQLTADQGLQVLAAGRTARAALDAACATPSTVDAVRLAEAQAEVERAQQVLGGVR